MNRVVISGIGIVSPVGSNVAEFWTALVEGQSGIGPLTIIPTERLSTRIAAQVIGFDPDAHFRPKQAHLLDRFAQFALFASRAAVRDAQCEISEELALDAATVIGSGGGGQSSMDAVYFKFYGQSSDKVHPLSIPRWMVNAAASHVSIDLGLRGPTWTVATACASGAHAIGQAFHMVRSGQAPIAVAGGTEACLTVGTVKAWEALRVLSTDTCRPFSRNRSGIVLGEGAAMFVLEPRDRALARGARVYAEVLGFGMSADAVDITAADADGGARAMRAALRDARVDPDDDRLRQCPRHRDYPQRPDRVGGAQAGIRHARRSPPGIVEQGCSRPWHGGCGRARARRHRAGLANTDHSAHCEFRGAGSHLRSRLRAQCRA